MPTPPNPQFRLIALPSLFIEHGRIDRYLPPGSPVSDYMRRIGWDPKTMHARVSIDGRLVDQAQWEYTLPQAGQSVVMRCIPGAGGAGGGGGGKNALKIVAMLGIIALMFAAPELAIAGFGLLGEAGAMGMSALMYGSGGVGALLLMGGVGIGGMLAANAHIPAPLPRRSLPFPQPRPTLPVAA